MVAKKGAPVIVQMLLLCHIFFSNQYDSHHRNQSGRFRSEAPFFPFLLAPVNMSAAVAELVVADAVVVKVRQDIVYRRLRDVVQRLFR